MTLSLPPPAKRKRPPGFMTEAPPTCPKCGEPMEEVPSRIGVYYHPAEMIPDEKAFAGGWACTDCGWEVEDERDDHDD